ncbi:MAG: NAD-dependent epimerase/dehydratase family protein [Candidatus Omnitrophota bacterium]|nr:NAD-dependent epimerase/dehydratase family protein [Candidatus Omnitrophota bacterium]
MNLVTGATGFVGSHIVSQLLARGEKVRVLVRPASPAKNLQGMEVERSQGDLTDRASLKAALAGCRRVYHVAADYRLWTPDPSALYLNNVVGTRNVLETAREAKVERIVYTSTVGALGHARSGDGAASVSANEETPVSLHDMTGHYKRSKFLAEAEVTAAARAGLPVVIVNPSTPVGSRDIKPTPTGQMIVDFLNGRMPAYVETGLNLIDVEDVAAGHLLAMEKGQVGQRYILGHRNLSLKEILEMLAKISGRPAPTVRLPHVIALGVAAVSTLAAQITRRPPLVSWESVRISKHKMFFDSSKAVRDLGLPQGSVEEALSKAVYWFRKNGYIRN